MGKEPSDIRTEIEQTRERVGDEVDAISYKTDVPARMGDFVDNKKQALTGKLSDVKDAVAGTASNVLPDGERGGRLKDTAERNPLGLAVGGVALGFVAGLLLPSTRVENKAMGETSDKITDAVKETASDAIESGKQVAQDATDSAKTQAHDIASTLQDRTQETLTTPSQTTASG